MENTTDSLEVIISKAKEQLSNESREAIDSVGWRQIISGMNIKFNSEQLDDLKTEVELLLCGLTATEKFPIELENRLIISKNEVASLVNELDRLIFKKIQTKLENILKDVTPQTNKPLTFDPRFLNISQKTQEAIAMSDWQKELYEIAKKYTLSIDKLDPLEKLTVQLITGEIDAHKYQYEIGQQFNLSREDSSNLVTDVDNKILKIIKENLKTNWDKDEDAVPLPPYGKVIKNEELRIRNGETTINNEGKVITDYQLPINNEGKVITDYQLPINNEGKEDKNGGIGGISYEPIKKDTSVVTPLAINMLKDKLGSTTTSASTISDYSLPKINSFNQPATPPVAFSSNLHDPYHEEI